MIRKSRRVVPSRIRQGIPAKHERQARIRAIPEVPARTPSPILRGDPLFATQIHPRRELNARREDPSRKRQGIPAKHERQGRMRASPEAPAL